MHWIDSSQLGKRPPSRGGRRRQHATKSSPVAENIPHFVSNKILNRCAIRLAGFFPTVVLLVVFPGLDLLFALAFFGSLHQSKSFCHSGLVRCYVVCSEPKSHSEASNHLYYLNNPYKELFYGYIVGAILQRAKARNKDINIELVTSSCPCHCRTVVCKGMFIAIRYLPKVRCTMKPRSGQAE